MLLALSIAFSTAQLAFYKATIFTPAIMALHPWMNAIYL